MAIGRTNASAGGAKPLVTATARLTIAGHKSGTVSLTCDFDPLVVYAVGPNYIGSQYANSSIYRLNADDPWSAYEGNMSISVSGRTISASFTSDIDFNATAIVRAWGFQD